MAKFIVSGGQRLSGELEISGAKNAALPLLAACVLTDEEVILHNCPRIGDVFNMKEILVKLGARVRFSGNTVSVCAEQMNTSHMPEELSHKIRSSIFLLGSMIGRMRSARFFMPGGCEIGARPIDQHIHALEQLGVQVNEEAGTISCKADTLTGAQIRLEYPSVGATENAIFAAVLAKGESVIYNAAREPEIEDVQALLNAMGARVRGAGSSQIVIQGVGRLHGAEHACIPDRIEAGTFLAAACLTRGDLLVKRVFAEHIRSTMDVFEQAGALVAVQGDAVRLRLRSRIKPLHVITLPYPAFPTDMQAQMCAVAALGEGVSRITETVFENRMRHVPELMKMGADISLRGASAYITGVCSLQPARVYAHDLRGGAALTLAALSANGESVIEGAEHIDRGYEGFEHKLASLGADIRRTD